MSLASITLSQIFIMFIIILIGIICYKTKIVNPESNKTLSNIVLMLINPMVIFVSYQMDFEMRLFKGLIVSLILGIITFIISIIISIILIKKNKNYDTAIERFSAIYSNCGFIGIPLANGIFGKEGVFYITAYLTIFNLFVWTHGIIIMTGEKDIKQISKAILSPSIIAIFLGMIFFIFGIKLPVPIYEGFNSIASMNTPFAMLVAGITIAQTNVLKIFKKIRIYYICIIKLLILPIVMVFLFSFLNFERTVIITSILATSCPTGATGTLFAIKYNKDSLYASELFAMTTIFSIFTIPFIMLIVENIIK